MRPPRSVTAAYPALLCEDARDDRPDLLRARAAGAGARALARARSSQRVDRAGRRHARRPAVPRPAHGDAGEGRVKLRLVALVLLTASACVPDLTPDDEVATVPTPDP